MTRVAFIACMFVLSFAGVAQAQGTSITFRWRIFEPPGVETYYVIINGRTVGSWPRSASINEGGGVYHWTYLVSEVVTSDDDIRLVAGNAGGLSDPSNRYLWPTPTTTASATEIPLVTVTPTATGTVTSTPTPSASPTASMTSTVTSVPTLTPTQKPIPTPPQVLSIQITVVVTSTPPPITVTITTPTP